MADHFLTALALGVTGAGSALSAGGTLMAGNAQADALHATRFNQLLAGKYKADELRMAANEAQGASQREAMAFSRNKDMLLSRARAVAGASGGGATDTSVLKTMGGIEQQGEFQKAMALYAGENRANNLRYEADNAWKEAVNNDAAIQHEAGMTRYNAKMSAMGTLLGGAGSALNQYNYSELYKTRQR
jgi:hypothetical protein